MYDNYNGISTHRSLPSGNQIAGSRSAFLTGTDAYARAQRRVASDAAGVDYTSSMDAKSMSDSEYKTYVAGVIDGMTMHPTRKGDISAVDLSEDVLAKMKEDPDYANEVLNQIRQEFESSAPSSQDTQAFSYSWLDDIMQQVQTERWLSPFDTSFGYDKFASKSRNSLWGNWNSNAMVSGLLIKAQNKQVEMAQQAALQLQAKLGIQGSASTDGATATDKTE